MDYTDMEDWERFFFDNKNPELCGLVVRIANLALENDTFSAEALHKVPVTTKNLRGAAFKHASRLGIIRAVAFDRGHTKASHGHILFLWTCASRSTASAVIAEYGSTQFE